MGAKVVVENVKQPGKTYRVEADKYHAMKAAVLAVLPAASPGVTADDLRRGVVAHLPQDLFPGGEKAGWWMKCVQLDLEAKGVVAREATRPLRFHRTQAMMDRHMREAAQ